VALFFFPGFFEKDLTKQWRFIIFRYMSNYRDHNIEKFADMFKALSNPNRLKIFMRLVSCCIPKVVTRISSSPEFKELRQAGLIRMERRGQKIECWIDPETLTALQGFFSKQTPD
jgi:ArsR family transcriptional regulator